MTRRPAGGSGGSVPSVSAQTRLPARTASRLSSAEGPWKQPVISQQMSWSGTPGGPPPEPPWCFAGVMVRPDTVACFPVCLGSWEVASSWQENLFSHQGCAELNLGRCERPSCSGHPSQLGYGPAAGCVGRASQNLSCCLSQRSSGREPQKWRPGAPVGSGFHRRGWCACRPCGVPRGAPPTGAFHLPLG